MRLAFVVLSILLVAVPARAAGQTDLGRLVLRATDVPPGFVVDPDETGPRSNRQEWRDEPEARRVLQRAKRVTGYEARYDRGDDSISSRVDLFRSAAGARIVLDYFASQMRLSGIRGLYSQRLALGDEGRLYGDRQGSALTIVVWRSGRVFSAVASAGVRRARVVSLARLQQRRIATAFR